MKRNIFPGFCAAFILLSSMPASADSTLHIWQCELRDGKTFVDAAAAAGAWIAAVRSAGAGKDSQLTLEAPLASPLSENTFNFVLSVADPKAWGELWTNVNGEELFAANQAWSTVASCDAGSIWNSVDIE